MITFDGISQKEITIDTTTIQPFECLLGAFVGAEFPGGNRRTAKVHSEKHKAKKEKIKPQAGATSRRQGACSTCH